MAVMTDAVRDRMPEGHQENWNDPVLQDMRAFYDALEQSPDELMAQSLRSVIHHRQSGTLTNEEAEALIRQLAAAAIQAHVTNALAEFWLAPPTARRGDLWRSFRSWRRSLTTRPSITP